MKTENTVNNEREDASCTERKKSILYEIALIDALSKIEAGIKRYW